jgi:hypothetical protein
LLRTTLTFVNQLERRSAAAARKPRPRKI